MKNINGSTEKERALKFEIERFLTKWIAELYDGDIKGNKAVELITEMERIRDAMHESQDVFS